LYICPQISAGRGGTHENRRDRSARPVKALRHSRRQRGRNPQKRSRNLRAGRAQFKGTLDLNRGDSDAVTAKVRAATPEDERKLLSSFLGFVDRHAGDQVTTITIHYR
jgi:hypothetical protein